MTRDETPIPLASQIDDWGRWVLRTYFIGSILTLSSWSVLTFFGDFPGPYFWALMMASVIVPVIFLAVGLPLRLRRLRTGQDTIVPVDPHPAPGWRGAVSQMRWLLATLAMFGAWPGFYFVANKLGSIQAPVQFHHAVDTRLPMVTQLAPVYITIYWFFIFPALYGRDVRHFWALLRAYGTLMLVCTAVFVAYPVAFPRDPLVVHHIGDWALSIVRGADPPTNCFPSSHCAVATLSALALREVRPSAFLPGAALATAICVATVLTKQHYVVDTLAGIALGGGAYFTYFKPELRRRLVQAITARQ